MPPVRRPGSEGSNNKNEQDINKPDVRLAYWAHLDDRKAFEGVEPSQSDPPTVRLVGANDSGIAGARIIETATKNLGKGKNIEKDSPTIRLAHGPGAQGDNVLLGRNGVAPLPDYSLPGLLVSFFYLPQFLKNRHRYRYRDWVMDSGAFSAHNSGVTIDLKQYIETCKQLMAEDLSLVEIYSLDVIGDWKASLKNTEKMWAEGVPAIPCFHADEPWGALLTMAKDYPKIALGGVALAKSGKKMAWASQCFARVYPKRIHGFAFCSEKAMMALPFESCDSTSWEVGVCKYGQWRAFGGQRVSVRGSKQNLRLEVQYYLDLEERLRQRWKKEMIKLDEACPRYCLRPEVRLALGATGSDTCHKEGGAVQRGLSGPTVRLAEGGEGGRIEAKSKALKGKE